jgi:hypothetical protein
MLGDDEAQEQHRDEQSVFHTTKTVGTNSSDNNITGNNTSTPAHKVAEYPSQIANDRPALLEESVFTLEQEINFMEERVNNMDNPVLVEPLTAHL